MDDRTEGQIVANWPRRNNPLVSVIITTYNQEQYIRQAIDCVLAQETSFPFELIIHDDASTDTTREILTEYQSRYPSIVKPVLQTKNQFSQGKKIIPLAFGYCSGEYIALCEGDDYWVDKNKLQKQIDAFRRFPDCRICFHPALIFHNESPEKNGVVSDAGRAERIFPVEAVIKGGGGFCPTASLMIHRSVFDSLPDWFPTVPVGDYYLQVFGACNGGALYLPDVMSAYRFARPGSFTTGDKVSHVAKIKDRIAQELRCLQLLDEFLAQRYIEAISHIQAVWLKEHATLALRNKHFELFNELIEKSWSVRPSISTAQKILFRFRAVPAILMITLKFKSVIYPFGYSVNKCNVKVK